MAQGSDERFVYLVRKALDTGLPDRLLLSSDVLGYDAAAPAGGDLEPYTYLPETFLPSLARAGVDEVTIRRLTHDNPFDAFARDNSRIRLDTNRVRGYMYLILSTDTGGNRAMRRLVGLWYGVV